MDQAELSGLIAQRPQNFAWFIGAGASRTAGLPTATDIIWYMKRRYYRQEENQDVSEQDAQHDAVKAKIQAFMDSRGFPEAWSEGEYSAYFDRIFGDDKERQRRFLSAILSEDRVTLSVGNRVLAAMLAAGFTRMVFTTNFDTVVERAYAEVSHRSLMAFHLEGSRSAIRALNNEDFPLYCKMHGDFRHDSIKNLTADLATQNDELARCFQSATTRAGFIVAGFSGRDASVMELFRHALDQPNAFPNGFFWTEIKGLAPPPAVTALIEKAKSKGIESGLIPIETYDALMLHIWRNLDNKPPDLARMVNRTALTAVNIPIPQPGRTPPLLRLNALPISSLPRQCMSLAFAEPPGWDDVRQARLRADGTVILTKTNSILGWGAAEDLKDAFGGTMLSSKIEQLPDDIGTEGTTVIKGFMEEALCKALSRDKPLVCRTNATAAWLIAAPEADTESVLAPLAPVVGNPTGVIPGLFTPIDDEHREPQRVSWAEAVRVSIDQRDGRTWLLLDPDVWIWPARARRYAGDFLDRRRSDRFNRKHNSLLSAWVAILLGKDSQDIITLTAFDVAAGVDNPSFTIHRSLGETRRIG